MTRTQLIHVLLVFDHKAGKLIDEPRRFTSSDEAVEVYSTTEQQYGGQHDIEIVLVASDSLETIERTHANYFDGTVSTSHFLAGVE